MKLLLIFQTLLLSILHFKAWIGAGGLAAAKFHIFHANMGNYLSQAKRRIPAQFESYEQMCNYEQLDGPAVISAINKNPNLITSMPPHIQSMVASGNFGTAANAMIGRGESSSGTSVGGALNPKKNVQATFKVVVSAPYVTVAGTGTEAPDSGQYNIPIFGAQFANSSYSIPGILACSVAGYTGYAISGATVSQTGGTLPAPFQSVTVDPTAWYFLYINKVNPDETKAAMWAVTTNPNYPYTAFLPSMFHTRFHVNRARYILGNSAEQDQFGYALSKGYQTLFGNIGYDTIDPDIFLSPEQLQTGRMDIDLGLSFTAMDFLNCPTDPVTVPSGFRFGMFVEKYVRQARAKS
jgi:hypothetical protein